MKVLLSIIVMLTFPVVFECKADPPLPEGRRLRDIVAEVYPQGNVFIGAATSWNKRERGAGAVLEREFSYVTPEDEFKQKIVHPMPGVWDWTAADAWVKQTSKSDQILRIHGPVGPQCSSWAKSDDRTAEELRRNLEKYMTSLCQRYNKEEHVTWIDVVNETVQRNGKWLGPEAGTDIWENPWPLIGYDKEHPLEPPLYIKMAFEIAKRNAPEKKLIINQHGGMEEPMWEKVKSVVHYLREQGLRVDGIGWQAHINVGWEKDQANLNRLRALVDWAHSNGLSFHITEHNVWMKGEKDYASQAETFAVILEILLKKRFTGLVSWNVWGISDGDLWKRARSWEGCLFFEDFSPKPAYYAIQEVLINPPD